MADALPGLLAIAAIITIVAIVTIAERRRRPGDPRHVGWPGPGASGAIYDLLNQDKRNAIEIIVEEKAEARDPERATDQDLA